jgi:hypothetical protein
VSKLKNDEEDGPLKASKNSGMMSKTTVTILNMV